MNSFENTDALVWTADTSGQIDADVTAKGNKNIRPNVNGNAGTIQAVYLYETDRTYIQPGLSGSNGELTFSPNTGDADPVCEGAVAPSELVVEDGEVRCPGGS